MLRLQNNNKIYQCNDNYHYYDYNQSPEDGSRTNFGSVMVVKYTSHDWRDYIGLSKFVPKQICSYCAVTLLVAV
jgi:hypothetical protein